MNILVLFFALVTLCLNASEKETTVKADSAIFDGEKIVLSGDVEVLNLCYKIAAKKALLLRDEKKESNFEFPWVELSDGVKAKFYDEYCLECDQVNLDYLKNTLTFTSEKKIVFYDSTKKLFADKAIVDYQEIEGDYQVTKILLLGNVEMYTKVDTAKEKKEQYALADHVEYFPKNEVLILKADSGKRVLFFDKLKEITISAESVRAERKNGKEVLEGIGDVRFTFKEDEFEKLKSRFALK